RGPPRAPAAGAAAPRGACAAGGGGGRGGRVGGAVAPSAPPLLRVTGWGGRGGGSPPPFVRSGHLREAPGPVGTRVPESAFTAGSLPHENFISAPPGPAAGAAPGQDAAAGAPIMPGMIGHGGPDEEGHHTPSWLVEQDDSWADGTPSNVSFLTRSER